MGRLHPAWCIVVLSHTFHTRWSHAQLFLFHNVTSVALWIWQNKCSMTAKKGCFLLCVFFSLFFKIGRATLFFISLFFGGLQHSECRILVPQPEIKRMPLALEAWNLNHWTTRDVLSLFFIKV